MSHKQICPKCKTGADSYKLDPKNPVCPYAQHYNGKSCSFFSPLSESEVKDYEGFSRNNNGNAAKNGEY